MGNLAYRCTLNNSELFYLSSRCLFPTNQHDRPSMVQGVLQAEVSGGGVGGVSRFTGLSPCTMAQIPTPFAQPPETRRTSHYPETHSIIHYLSTWSAKGGYARNLWLGAVTEQMPALNH